MTELVHRLHGLRYLRVVRGQKERKRRRLEAELADLIVEIYSIDREIEQLIVKEAGLSLGAE